MFSCVNPSRDHARPHTALCLVAEEDCRGVRRRLVQHTHFWLLREYSPLSAIALVLIVQWQWGSFWMRYDYMICPVKDLGANAWNPPTCKPNDVFVWRHYELMQPAAAIVSFLVHSFPWCWLVIQTLNDYCSAEGLSNRSLGLPINSTFWSWHASRVWSPLSEGSSRLDSRGPSMSRILDRVSRATAA